MLCTGFGINNDTYGSTINELIYVIGQGSCASPILWVLINQIIIATLEEKHDCIGLVAVDGDLEHIRPGESFVDDTTCGSKYTNVDMEPATVSMADLTEGEYFLVGQMEEIIQFFLDLLQVTGGGLAPEKCAWFIIACKWKEGKPQ
jgi:hypothetical protein